LALSRCCSVVVMIAMSAYEELGMYYRAFRPCE
jgi:hypothetical protein